MAGMAFDFDRIVKREKRSTGRFALFHLNGCLVEAVEAANAAGEFMFINSLIAKKLAVDPEKLADVSVPIKEAVA